MARAAQIRVAFEGGNRRLPYRVNIGPDLSLSGKRERHYFATRAEADRFVSGEVRRLSAYRERSLGLTDAQKIEAAECFSLVEQHGRTLREALAVAVAGWTRQSSSVSIDVLVAGVLANKEQDQRSRAHVQQLRSLLNRFAASHPQQIVSDFTGRQIDEWLRSLGIGSISRDSYRRCLSVAFAFAKRSGWCDANPVEDVARVGGIRGEVSILTPTQTESLLRACPHSALAYTALCAFAGLRPSEAARLRWTDVSSDTIQIRASNAKTRKHRFVPILPNLREWLGVAPREKSGLVGFPRERFREAVRTAKLNPWPQDVLRHSFGTYRFPILQHEGQLAQEMGNSPDIIIRHYRRLTDQKTAQEYFGIVP